MIPPRFLKQPYLWSIAIQPTVGCYNLWADILCFGCSPLGEIVVKQDNSSRILSCQANDKRVAYLSAGKGLDKGLLLLQLDGEIMGAWKPRLVKGLRNDIDWRLTGDSMQVRISSLGRTWHGDVFRTPHPIHMEFTGHDWILPHKGPIMWISVVSFFVSMNNLLNK